MAAARRATYADVLAVPPHKIAEIVAGALHVSPRPASPHASASTFLVGELHAPFGRGRGGPGGWHILHEPELHLDEDVLVPDLAGWRRAQVPKLPNAAFFTIVPAWVCEVLSPSTRRFDRSEKLPIYARAGVKHAWLIDPLERTLEVLRLESGRWAILAVHAGDVRVHAEPFEELELELDEMWASVESA